MDQVVRPTGLLDPPIEVRDTDYPVDDLMEEIRQSQQADTRVLVTTLTKRMAEELTDYLLKNGVSTAYIHSDVDTLERVQIMSDLRRGVYQVLVGVNLLREGLDLPEVSLVAILDADKEGFLRSARSLTQTAGRAARNVNGKVIMYAKTITQSMQQTIDETERRRAKQMAYNEAHHLVPRQIVKSLDQNALASLSAKGAEQKSQHASLSLQTKGYAASQNDYLRAAEPAAAYGKQPMDKQERIGQLKKRMKEAAAQFDFILAAQLRDELLALEKE